MYCIITQQTPIGFLELDTSVPTNAPNSSEKSPKASYGIISDNDNDIIGIIGPPIFGEEAVDFRDSNVKGPTSLGVLQE
jgi:hypothetical protein